VKKKIAFPLLALLLVILLLPVIGNKTINSTIETRLNELESKGISYKIIKDESSYLKTKKSYTFKVDNREKFLDFLLKQAHQQVPPYLNMLLDGTEIGIDAEYANIPIFDLVSLDIYPTQLPKSQMKSLEEESQDSYQKVLQFLRDKKLLYHIDYDIIDMKFNGYIKDIDDGIMFKKGNEVHFSLKDVKFSGTGLLIKPDSYISNVKKMHVSVNSFSNEVMSLRVDDLHAKGKFLSKLEFKTILKLSYFEMKIKQDRVYDAILKVNKLDADVETHGVKTTIEALSDTHFENLALQFQGDVLDLNNTTLNFKVSDVDKKTFEDAQKALELLEKKQTKEAEQLSMQKSLEFIAKGFQINIEEFSIKNTSFNKENLGSFYSKLHCDVKEDKDIFSKIGKANEALKNIVLTGTIQFSKTLFDEFKKYTPAFILLENVAIKKDDTYIFDVELKDALTKINGKRL